MQQNKSYLDIYTGYIVPRIERADILLKTAEGDIQPGVAAEVLEISPWEVRHLMDLYHLRHITAGTFPLIMQGGSSRLCRLFARELQLGCTDSYLPAGIAYIYNLDRKAVEAAFRSLGITSATGSMLREIFARIPL